MDLKLNFIGITVNDFDSSFRFYTETLGMKTRDWHSGWALFDTTGMVFELFGDGAHNGGNSQTVQPILYVADTRTVSRELNKMGIVIMGIFDGRDDAPFAGFVAPEGLCWLLQDSPDQSESNDLSKLHIGG